MSRHFIVGCLFLIACDGSTPQPAPNGEPPPQANAPAVEPPTLPKGSVDFGPSLTTLSTAAPYNLEVHKEVAQCAECHAPIVEEWNDSVHALASMSNPFYRVAFDDFSAKSGAEKLPFCGGCHDPALLYDGALKQPIDGSSVRAHTGVSCNTCHGVEAVTTDGNASYTLNTTPIPIPKDGDADSLKAHLGRVGMAALRTNDLCVSCHRGFMSPETGHEVVISGLDEWGPFRGSGYNGNLVGRIVDVAPTNCVGCHMPTTPDGHNSHRFAGGHSTLAKMASPEQFEAVKALVEDAATIDIAAYGVGEVALRPWTGAKDGDSVWFDVVVHNKNVGHVFPGGAQDLRDTWVEVEVKDANGKVVATAGTDHENSGADPSAYVLQAYMVDDQGKRVVDHAVHGFRTPAFKHSIGPKDSAVIRYRFEHGAAAEPLTVTASLRHRRLTKTFQDATCKHTKRPEDVVFQAGAKQFRGFEGNPCEPQPVLEIDRNTTTFGRPTASENPEWVRQYQRGQGLAHHVSESLDEASEAFLATLALLGEKGEARAIAKTRFELGRVYGRQGRLQDAMDQFALAEKLIGEHPAIEYARGQANHRVFKFKDAVLWYDKASKLADDDRIWRELAIAAGSISDTDATYRAARAGLKIEPRDPHLLRNQMLALKKLGGDPAWLEGANKAFGDFKRDEQAPNIQDTCAANDDQCRKGRIPVQVIDMITP